jgi:hypothetical protein
MKMRNWLIALIAGLLLIVPPLVGYATAPCDSLTAQPLVLSPYRLAQQRYLTRAAAALTEMAAIAPELQALAAQTAPVSSAEAFRRAGRATDLATRLEQIALPDPPAVYTVRGRLAQCVIPTFWLRIFAAYWQHDLAQLQAAGEL